MTDTALRVGLIIPRFAPYLGGAETYAAQAAAALAAKGAEVTVITQIPRRATLSARDRQDGYNIERYDLPVGEVFDLPSPAAAGTARQSRRFDVVWVHSYHTPLAWLAAEQAKAPVVLTPWYHGAGHTPMRNAMHRFYRPAGRRLMAACRRILVATQAEADLVMRDFSRQVDSDKISLAPVGVPDPVGGRTPYPGQSNVVLTVARQEPYKRTDVLIRAVAHLRDNGVPARLVVVGQGSGLAAYRELATALDADDVVTFTGAIDDEALGRWWATASLYATASLHEAFGLCLGEALVTGLPVVASGIGAHREVIRRAGPGAAAALCELDGESADSVLQYADAIARLLRSTGSRKARAAQCTLPTEDEMVNHLLKTLSAARS
ncbi:glycosyltransferase family 4 protein [Mycobacterium sp. 3519A]|uniref:glycosyltransferase family 4 protein n=1 Tax=Mycobacterium sp. 3519A TaxID=2057184 RepID=UPI000C7B346F|nr:glycosyltransferase family 4 protein [Mycobacterium sp. 3519A]